MRDRRRAFGNRQSRGSAGGLVDVVEQARLGDLAADRGHASLHEALPIQSRDAAGRREALEERQEPVGAAVAGEAVDLGEVQRQVVGQDAMPGLGLGFRDRLVGLRQLLQIVDPGCERIDIALGGTDPEHVQDDLRVLRVVLVPAVVQRLAGAGQRDGGDQPQLEAGREQAIGERPMVVAGRLEADDDRAAEGGQDLHEAVIVGLGAQEVSRRRV